MQKIYPQVLHGGGPARNDMYQTRDGIENNKLYINSKTIGTGNENLVIDADQNCLVMGPVTINATLTINGTLKVI
jgi:hypothetical protein